MRGRMTPWLSLILAALALALLWVGGVGIGLLLGSAVLMAGSLLALWSWLSDLPPPPAQRATPEELRLARVEAEAATRRAIEATVEAVSLPLLVIDRQRILSANAPARSVLGEHILGQDPRVALRHPEAVGIFESPDGEETSVTIRNLTTSGSLWQITRCAIGEERWVIELRDRTAEADISRAHTDFVANASHELRTPLASVIGYVETLIEAGGGALDEAVTKRFLGTVLREAKRMQNLVSDLMSLSQLEAEKHDAPTERIDLAALAARVVGEFPPVAGEAARVEFDRPTQVFAVTGDIKQLEQLLRNLIDNALKYGDADKPVTVALSAGPRDRVQMVVSDRGAGIAPDHLPHLTRRFYRTDASRSRAAGGTGLGLAIVKHIVERHRGRLDITSKIGVGTKVSVRLPRAAP